MFELITKDTVSEAQPAVTITEYVPLDKSIKEEVVAPFDHR
jgi:hypothetical protein